jgi:hypothetical protein
MAEDREGSCLTHPCGKLAQPLTEHIEVVHPAWHRRRLAKARQIWHDDAQLGGKRTGGDSKTLKSMVVTTVTVHEYQRRCVC